MGKAVSLFTPEELEELKAFDAEVDAMELTYEDYLFEDFVDSLLFPEKAAESVKRKTRYRERIAAKKKDGTYEAVARKYKEEYAKKDKAAERERKREWYRRNKERVALQQRDYRIRAGIQKPAE